VFITTTTNAQKGTTSNPITEKTELAAIAYASIASVLMQKVNDPCSSSFLQ
jgi:hypothetical protein